MHMGIPDTTFERCRRLAANPWMMGHIERNEISLTNAHLLLEAAGGKGGPAAVENLRNDFAHEVAKVKAKIILKEADLAD